MGCTILIESDEASEPIFDLQTWLHNAELDDVDVKLAPGRSVPGTLGAELSSGLMLLFKSHALPGLARALASWIKVRKPKVKLTFKSGQKQIVLETENAPVDRELIDNLTALITNSN